MKRHNIIFILACMIGLSACDKMNLAPVTESYEISAESQVECFRSFAVIMSKALYNEPELREFVKKEALLRKDLDYDVFYPWVKDVVLSSGRTFEDILREYDSKDELDVIIRSCPLLTILVPDWSWVHEECFSPDKWDTDSPDVGVSYRFSTPSHEIFHNGEYAFSVETGEYPTVPVLIVKNNERITYGGATKSGEGVYAFDSNDYIDVQPDVPTKKTSTYETIDVNYTPSSTTNVVSAVQLYSRVRGAYGVTNGYDIPQRDYIYYGMTPTVTQGTVDKNYYERIHKIKISPSAKGIFDDPVGVTSTGTDYNGVEVYLEGRKNSMSQDEIYAMIWGEGSIELKIKVFAGATPLVKMLSVPFASAFNTKQIELRTNKNWLGAVKSRTYYLDIPEDNNASECLESKWINVNYDLFYWDLTTYPKEYYVEFWECDADTSVSRDVTYSYNYMTNFAVDASASMDPIKVGWSTGASETVAKNNTSKESYTQSDDEFGNFVVQYSDKIVLSQTNASATIKTYSTGYIDVMIIPCYN